MKGSVQNDINLHGPDYPLAFAYRLCCAWWSRLWWGRLGFFRLWSASRTSTPFDWAGLRACLGGESRLADLLDRGTLHCLPVGLLNTLNSALCAFHPGTGGHRAAWSRLHLPGSRGSIRHHA